MAYRRLSKRRNKRYWSYIHNIAEAQRNYDRFTGFKDIRARVKFVKQQRHERSERFTFLRNNINKLKFDDFGNKRVLTQGESDVLLSYMTEFEIDFGYPEGQSP